MNDILKQSLNVPASCEVNNTIFKKLFYENADMNKVDRDIFAEHIDKITWLYCLKPDSINILPHKDDIREYAEIEILEVKLNKETKTKRISEVIMRTIPYPMLLIFSYHESIQLVVAHQRINLSDSSKNTIEEFILTEWIDFENLTAKDQKLLNSLELKGLSHINFYRLYSDIVDRIIVYNASELTVGYIDVENVTKVKEVYDEVGKLDKEIENLRMKIKRETQINRRVELNVAIKKLEALRKGLIEKLK